MAYEAFDDGDLKWDYLMLPMKNCKPFTIRLGSNATAYLWIQGSIRIWIKLFSYKRKSMDALMMKI